MVDHPVIDGETYTRTTVQANTDGFINGWEISYRRNFDFLPGPLSGFGDVNYCGIDSEIDSPLRPDKPDLEQQPEYILNASLFYAYKGSSFAWPPLKRANRSMDRRRRADDESRRRSRPLGPLGQLQLRPGADLSGIR